MANRIRSQSGTAVRYRMPVDGTAARKPVAVENVRAAAKERARRGELEVADVSTRTMRNRSRALSVSRGYVLFLAAMAVLTVIMCVYFLQMKEMVTTQLEQNAKLESRLTAVTSENDALYETITNSVDWEHVKDVAINKLGMTYATEDQVIWYNIENSGYVRQFRDVPTGN